MNSSKKVTKTLLPSCLLFMLFFVSGISLCMKPVCTGLVREAYIGRAIALRMNDVINEYEPDMAPDTGVALQEQIMSHPRLLPVISRYLDALAVFSRNGNWQKPDTIRFLREMNQDISNTMEQKLHLQAHTQNQEAFLSDLLDAQEEVIAILDSLPDTSLVRDVRPVLLLYGALTSALFQIICFLLILVLVVRMYRNGQSFRSWAKAVGGTALVNGAMTGILVPLLCRMLTLSVTNRFLGRSMYIDMTAFRIAGALSAGVGAFLLLSGICFRSLPSATERVR